MRAFALVAALLFGTAAAVQWNDPDPLAWILLYGGAAGLAGANAWNAAPAALYFGLATIAGVWAAALVPGVLREAAFSGNEIERELAGLLLVCGTMIALGRHARSDAGAPQ